MSIRTAALVAFVGAVAGLLMPLWNVTQVVTGVVSSHPGWKWWVIPIAVLVGAPLAASMPVFYFALYRNREPLRFSRRFRLLSLAAALIVGIVTVVVLSTSVGVLGLGGNTSVLPEVRDGWNIGKTVALVGGISNLTYILLLLSIFQRCDLESSAIASTSDLFRFITKTAVMVGGTLLAISVLRLVFTPVVYFQVRDYVSRMGRRPPELSDMMEEPLRMLVAQGCLLVAPFIVYRRIVRRRGGVALPASDGTSELGVSESSPVSNDRTGQEFGKI